MDKHSQWRVFGGTESTKSVNPDVATTEVSEFVKLIMLLNRRLRTITIIVERPKNAAVASLEYLVHCAKTRKAYCPRFHIYFSIVAICWL